MTAADVVGFAFSWWLTFGWTAGYEDDEIIFWLGPVGIIFEES